MSIKSAVLAVVLGVVAAGAAQAQSVVNVAIHTAPVRTAPAPAPHAGWHALPESGMVQVNHRPGHLVRIQVGQRLTREQLRYARNVDWRRAGLRAPARAQRWISLQGRYVLINTSNNRVVSVRR